MNRYRIDFIKECPVNGHSIGYRLEIHSPDSIMAEAIELAIDNIPSPIFHERAADWLAQELGGEQVLCATHGRVKIKTYRVGGDHGKA